MTVVLRALGFSAHPERSVNGVEGSRNHTPFFHIEEQESVSQTPSLQYAPCFIPVASSPLFDTATPAAYTGGKHLSGGIMTVRERVLTVDGKPIQLFEAGEGPPLLYLHGAGTFWWMPVHELLARTFHVYLPVHPGFGDSVGGDKVEEVTH
jgi:hypothetical protein